MSEIVNFVAADGYYLGEDKQLNWKIVSPQGAVQPISGLTIKFSLAATNGGAELPGFPIQAVITDGANGACTVTIPAGATGSLSAGIHYYTLWVTDLGAKTELAGGTIALLAPQTVVPA